MAAVSDLVDITLCEFMEADPPAWKPELNERLEDFVTCLGVQDLRLPEVLFLLNAIGIKYGILTEIQYLVEARLQVQAPAAPSAIQLPFGEGALLAQLRKFAMDALLRDSAVTHRLKRALWLQNYERIRSIFETRVVKILTPPIFLCISTNPSRYNSSVPQIQDRTSEHLKHMYRDLYYVEHSSEEGHQKYPFLKRWLSDDTKQTYLTCIFDPKGSLARNYNTYVGMRASTLPPAPSAAQAGVQAILHHIQEVFCNGNQEHAAYVVRWLANIVKYPWKKTEVLLLLFGVEGCGKSMIVDFFANMVLGSHLAFQTASPGVDVFGKFAVGTHRKLLCFCDEGGEELTKYQDMLKNLITAKAIRFEMKGQDIRVEDNYTNVIVASNNPGPVKISSNDRRVCAFQCSEVYKDNVPYFATLASFLGSDACARAFYDMLVSLDLEEDYPFQARRPITLYYESLLVSSLPLFWRFWSYKCLSVLQENFVKTEQARMLHKEFLTWKSERDYEAVYTEARFGRELNEMVFMENSGIVKIKRSTYYYEINFDTLRQFLIRKRKFDENAF